MDTIRCVGRHSRAAYIVIRSGGTGVPGQADRRVAMDWDADLSTSTQSVHLSVSAASEVGNVRSINEDSFLAGPSVFLVADGMGGHAHGDRASAAAVGVFASRHARESWTNSAAVLTSISEANAAVRALTPSDAVDEAIAGTTLTGVALLEPAAGGGASWIAFNVGDSRIYSWRAGHLDQVTVDHSAVQELVDLGEITREEAELHPERNVVTRAMGVDDDPDADVWLIPAGGEQLFLLCSDGLTKELSDGRIAELLSDVVAADGVSSTARRLVDAAVVAGGHDNVTVVVVKADWTDVKESDSKSGTAMPAFLEETAPRK
jgi:serine/threonine protein phosphatase PrpC